MSRKRVAYYVIGLLLASAPAYAQTPTIDSPAPMGAVPQDINKEIAYRAVLGRADDIKLLLTKGANPNQTTAEGLPILLAASARKDAEALNAVQALIEGGADVNAKDATGQTALYYAARAGKAEVVDYLLKHGINYYSLDNNGDIARTIAFRSGRNDIVDIMDEFVKSQTLRAKAIYENAEQTAAELAAEQEKQAQLEAERIAREAAEEEQRLAIEQERKLRMYKINLQKLQPKVIDISYNACAFQYWSFAQAMNQTTDLSEEETDEVIAMHREAVQDESLEIMKMFEVGQDYINQIINPSKQMIFDVLASMPSRTYRRENGVGRLQDVHKRCDRISKNWVVSDPANPGVPIEMPIMPKNELPKAAPVAKRSAPVPLPPKSIVPQQRRGVTHPGGKMVFQDGKGVVVD